MLSTAGIGRMVALAVRGSGDTRFVAVASRDAAKARGFAAEFGLPLSFGSYQDLLAWHEVDAVYVPLPVAMHTEWTIRALNAGKHVLCEKPFAVTAADAGRCFDAAEAASRLVIGQFDVGLDLTRRDELELIGTEGKVVVPDPWLCRTGRVELHSGAKAEYLAADPNGAFGLGPGEDDAYRIELDAASRAITGAPRPASAGRTRWSRR